MVDDVHVDRHQLALGEQVGNLDWRDRDGSGRVHRVPTGGVVVETRVMKGSFTVLWLAGDPLDRSVSNSRWLVGEGTTMRRRVERSRLIGAISDSKKEDHRSRSRRWASANVRERDREGLAVRGL